MPGHQPNLPPPLVFSWGDDEFDYQQDFGDMSDYGAPMMHSASQTSYHSSGISSSAGSQQQFFSDSGLSPVSPAMSSFDVNGNDFSRMTTMLSQPSSAAASYPKAYSGPNSISPSEVMYPPQLKIEDDEQLFSPPTDISGDINACVKGSKEEGWYCGFTGCANEKNERHMFGRRTDAARHVKTQHFPKWFDCQFKKCERKGSHGFNRKDHYTEHLRDYHHQDIPKAAKGSHRR